MIKIPSIKEVLVTQCRQEDIRQKLKKIELENYPIAVILDKMNKEEVAQAVEFVYWSLKNLGRNPHFPYPVFIVTDKISHHPEFPIVASTEKIPVHYLLEEKNLSKKDISTLNKISLIRDRVKNHDFSQIQSEMRELLSPNKKLYRTCKELDFYQRVLGLWAEKDKHE